MARPIIRRRIKIKPKCHLFIPAETNSERVILSLDEYECIRLIDLESLQQDACAKELNVARTTVQAIYKNARRKIADALINGKQLVIEGGNVYLNDEEDVYIPKDQRIDKRIAVTYQDGFVFSHFGQAQQFKIFDIVENNIKVTTIIDAKDAKRAALVDFLQSNHVDVLICGGIGENAYNLLKNADIEVINGANGEVDNVIKSYLNNTLEIDDNLKCNHPHTCTE